MNALYRRFRPLRQFAHACVFAACVGACGAAWGADETPPESKSALATLQKWTDRASELVMRSIGLLGIHYKYGGTTPETGMDCSGLVRYVFKESWGTDLPRTSAEISKLGERVDPKHLQPGDLVFYNTLRRGFSHVGIYLGDNRFIHSPAHGGEVRIESMELSYWKKRFNGARRIKESEFQFSDPEDHPS